MLWRPFTFIIAMITVLNLSLFYITGRYQTVRQEYQTLNQKYQAQIEVVKVQQQKLDALHQLDIKHTEELNNAKYEIDKLHDAVRAGTQRLRVNAVCKGHPNTPAQSRYDATTAQLSVAAREDYFRLQKMITENAQQTIYLQAYIRLQLQEKGKNHEHGTFSR